MGMQGGCTHLTKSTISEANQATPKTVAFLLSTQEQTLVILRHSRNTVFKKHGDFKKHGRVKILIIVFLESACLFSI